MSSQYTLLMRSLNTQPHQAAVVRVQPVYISDEESLHVQSNQPAVQPVHDKPPDQQAQH